MGNEGQGAGREERRGDSAPDAAGAGARGAAVVPLLYALQGMPYFLVQAASNTYFTAMGAAPSVVGRISSDLTLPWMLKPLWSPLVDLYGTKRRWLLGAAVAALVAIVATWGYGASSPETLFTVAGVLLLVVGLTARWLARPLGEIS